MDFSKINTLFLFVITLTAVVANSLCSAIYVKRKNVNVSDLFLINAGTGLFCSITLLFLGGFKIHLSAYSLLLGLAFGTITGLASFTQQSAIKKGPYGLTIVIINGSTAITALSGAILFSESLTLFKVLGMVFMIACILLSVEEKSEEGKKKSVWWLVLCVLAMSLTAMIGLTQKIHQNSSHKGELIGFLVVAFCVSMLFSLVMFFLTRKKEKKRETYVGFVFETKAILYIIFVMLLCGVCTGLNNSINLYLSGVVDSVVFFPIVNGVPLMASLITSFLIFKEKLAKKQIVGFLCGIVAILFFFL